MIRFVDLKTGNVFNADQSYTFWFEGEQSINLIYTKSICFISDKPELDVKFEQNEIFKLIDPKRLSTMDMENIHEFEYHNINKLYWEGGPVLKMAGYPHQNLFVYMMYVTASSPSTGEVRHAFEIDGETYTIGVDFYGCDETLYINLSNRGVDIPEAIQKALYDTNIHEDKIDNITLNRKWKELLSNYWDMIANKGSYKSLYNCLKWFEYGDLVKLGEIWKNREHCEIRDIQSILSDKYMETLSDFSKTTYEGLYLALSKPLVQGGKIIYNKEKNPMLGPVVTKWSKEDLALKMSMLGNFFETYFMPIHLDLIHSTIEDIVYTNTFKHINGTTKERIDYVYDIQDFKCSVKNGDVFQLGPVQCYVGVDTLFGSKFLDGEPVIIGVQKQQPKLSYKDTPDDDLKNYFSQLYYEVGSIVDFNIELDLDAQDFIKHSILSVRNKSWDKPVIRESYKILHSRFDFSLLCEMEGEYDVRMQFISASGKTFTKRVVFNTVDTNHTSIKIYKVNNIGCPMASFDRETRNWLYGINDYTTSRQIPSKDKNTLHQYIPAKHIDPLKSDHDGVCLNHMMILKGDRTNDMYLYVNYFVMTRITDGGVYTICISRKFGFHIDPNEKAKHEVYRESYIFMPEFHKLVEFGSDRVAKEDDIKFFTITDEDTLCVIPDISFGKQIQDYEWEFINTSIPTYKSMKLENSINEPFIANGEAAGLSTGYYTIVFKYRLCDDPKKVNTIVLDSAFRKI